MTNQQGKLLLASVIVIVGSYFFKDIVNSAAQILNFELSLISPRPKPAAKPPKPSTHGSVQALPPPAVSASLPVTAPPVPAKAPAAPSPFAKLQGVWRGRTALDGKGICDLTFELKGIADAPDRFAGYFTLTCAPNAPLMPSKTINAKAQTLNRMNPEAAILSGVVENQSLRFTVDKTVGTDSNGCAPTSFNITSFGAAQLAAEWQEGSSCRGGHVLLGRARQ